MLDGEQLETLIAKCEGIINSRPITPVSDDVRDMEALTPNHLLLLRGSQIPSRREEARMPTYRRRWAQVEYMAHLFWKRWSREYIPQLRERSKWTGECKNVNEGDLVLVVDPSTPRATWPLARVIEAIQGADGTVRTVRLRAPTGEMVRPVVKVCVLEEVAQQPPTVSSTLASQARPGSVGLNRSVPRGRVPRREKEAVGGLCLVRSRPRP